MIDYETLPEHFPAVSVATELGSDLKSTGRTIDIDIHALSEVLVDQGVPEDKLEDVDFMVSYPYKFGRRGEVGTDYDNGEYWISIFPSILQRFGLRSRRMQKTVVHEAKHVGDYVESGFLEDKAKMDRHYRLKKIRSRVGTAACTLTSIVLLPETVEHGSKPLIQEAAEQDSVGMLQAGVVLPVASVFLAYRLSKHSIYRAERMERRARKAARKTASNYPEIISIKK